MPGPAGEGPIKFRTPSLNRPPSAGVFCPPAHLRCRGKPTNDFGRKECPRLRPSGLCRSGPGQGDGPLRPGCRHHKKDARSRFGDDSDDATPHSSTPPAADLPDLSRPGKSPWPIEGRGLSLRRGIPGQQQLPRALQLRRARPVGQTHTIAGKGLKVRGFRLCSSLRQGGSAAPASATQPH